MIGRCQGLWRFAAAFFCAVPLIAAVDFRVSPARLTPKPAGPYHVSGNRILDAEGHDYLVRGTTLPEATMRLSEIQGEGVQFGVYSPASFVTIRQRLNMNAFRLPVNVPMYNQQAEYRARIVAIVRRANQFELLPILAADSSDKASAQALLDFWSRCAAEFKNYPNVFFALGTSLKAADIQGRAAGPHSASDWNVWLNGGALTNGSNFPGVQAMVTAIRAAGAAQPIVVAGFDDNELLAGLTLEFQPSDPNIVYEVTPRYTITRTDEDRQKQFGFLADRAPVLANDLDPQLDMKSAECAAFPNDPTAATQMVEDNLNYFDAHRISWTLSQFRPSRMLSEYRTFTWTKLDDGWTCGDTPARSGIGMVLLSHLWNEDSHGLLAVAAPAGGLVIARGAVTSAYGQVLAERQMPAPSGHPLPFVLGNVSVRVTDSRGVARLAPLMYTAAGWGHISFVIPPNSAPGPAEVAVVRTDGSFTPSKIIIADVAPGLWTAADDGRGPVIAKVTQRMPNGATKTMQTWDCDNTYACRTVPIPLSKNVSTTARIEGTGIRHADPHAAIRVSIGDVTVPVLSVGPVDDIGRDQITVKLPDELRGVGETDVFVTVNGILSNVARINCGSMQ
jgi:uncharacterized protein (TIGR03437 family)